MALVGLSPAGPGVAPTHPGISKRFLLLSTSAARSCYGVVQVRIRFGLHQVEAFVPSRPTQRIWSRSRSNCPPLFTEAHGELVVLTKYLVDQLPQHRLHSVG